MKELYDLAAALIDDDGSCRDLNFEDPTWEGVEDLLVSLESAYTFRRAENGEGLRIDEPVAKTIVAMARRDRYVHMILGEGNGIVKHLQVFISLEDDERPFVELSFFPQDLERPVTLRRDFIEWVDEVRARLQARRYFARYENASWQFGDTGPTSGVFLVSDEAATDA